MSTTRGIAVSAIGYIVPLIAALAAQPILAHGLGVSGRGEVAAATAPLQFAVAMLTLGLPESLTYHVARGAAGIARAMRMSLLALAFSGLAGCAIIAALALPLSAGDHELAQLIIVATSAVVPALLVTALRGVAMGRQAWRLVTYERTGSALLRLAAIGALFASESLTPLTATIAIAVTTFVGGLVYVGTARPSKLDGTPTVSRVNHSGLFGYAARVWLGAAAAIVLIRLDQLLMTPLSSVEQLGLYVVAASISEATVVLNAAIRDVLFSVESSSPDMSRTGRVSRISTLLTFAIGAAVAALCPWAIPFLFGTDFAGAVPATVILIAGAIVGNPGSVAGAGLNARGRPDLRSYSLLIAGTLNVVAVFLLVPPFGATGAAIAMFLSQLVAGNMNIIWLRIHFQAKLSEFYRPRRSDFASLTSIAVGFVRRNRN